MDEVTLALLGFAIDKAAHMMGRLVPHLDGVARECAREALVMIEEAGVCADSLAIEAAQR